MNDAAETTARTPREPFAGAPVRDLVRHVVAVTALLVGLALPWTATARGSDRLEIVLATFVAVAAIALPYARRAQLFTGAWAANEWRVRWIGVAPLVVVAVVHVLLDVVPGDAFGVGAGLGLGLAGAVLAAGTPWARTAAYIAGAIALGALAVPVLAVADGGHGAWTIVALVLTALLVVGILWLTAGRYEQGDQAAGVLLVGVGIVVALGAALVGGAAGGAWFESVHGTQFGLVLLPVVAAAVVPRVVGQTVLADAQPRLWARVAEHAFELGMLLGGAVALLAVTGLLGKAGRTEDRIAEYTLRLVFGVLVVVALYFARRALHRDLAAGHATAVGAAVAVSVLGLVLVTVRADGGTAVHPVDLLLAFGVPAIVLSVLLVPRSLRDLGSHGTAPLAEGALAGDVVGAADGGARPATAGTGSVPSVRTHGAGPAYGAATYGAAAGPEAAVAAAEVQTAEVQASIAPQVSAAQTAILRPVVDAPVVEPVTSTPADTGAPVEPSAPAQAAAPVEPAAPAQAAAPAQPETPAVGPFGSVGATQVLPSVVDVPGSPWSAAQALDPATPLADLALIVQEAPHLRHLVAANPSTYPALLDWLGALGDPDVDAALRTRG